MDLTGDGGADGSLLRPRVLQFAHEPGLAPMGPTDRTAENVAGKPTWPVPAENRGSLGRYTLVRRVGAGGMAEVWKAKVSGPAGFEKTVAVKRVLPSLAADREFVDMFVAEAKLVAMLEHPNIVPVFDFGVAQNAAEAGPGYYLAMEYVAGRNVASILDRLAEKRRVMPVHLALHIAGGIAAALAYAHDARDSAGNPLGIVHRDISPQNVMVTWRGEVKVTDFGIAKVASAMPVTGAGVWKGKIGYMSPEQATLRPLDGRSDLFALGTVLYELCTGKRLFQGSSASELYDAIVSFRADDAALAAVHGDVRPIARKALQLDPANRYADAHAFEAAIADALGARGVPRAKAALASMMQELFEDERRAEEQEPEAESIPSEAAFADTGVSMPTGMHADGGSLEMLAAEVRRVEDDPRLLTRRDRCGIPEPGSVPMWWFTRFPEEEVEGEPHETGIWRRLASVLLRRSVP